MARWSNDARQELLDHATDVRLLSEIATSQEAPSIETTSKKIRMTLVPVNSERSGSGADSELGPRKRSNPFVAPSQIWAGRADCLVLKWLR
jgi:hypothetical protein